MDNEPPFYMTTCEVAHLLRISPASVRRWCSRGQIECVRRRLTPGGPAKYLIPREAALQQLERVRPGAPPRPVALAPLEPEAVALCRKHGLL